MGNANYGGFDASNDWAKNAAFAIEKQLTTRWTHAQAQVHPLLAVLKRNGLNWNKGSDVSGLKMLKPVVVAGPTTAAAGVTDANELNAMTYNSTANFTQAEAEFAHYRNNFTLRDSERQLLEGGARGNILQGKTEQLEEDFKSVMQGHLSGSGAGTRSALMGILQPLSTSNTVGGISQTSYANWRSNVTTSVGTLTLQGVATMIDTIASFGPGPDLLICSAPASGFNSYGKMRLLIENAVVYNDPNNALVKAGVASFSYMGMAIVKDHRMATGNMAFLDTRTWYWRGYDAPKLVRKDGIQATDATEFVFNFWGSIACFNPKHNGLFTGVTG